MSATAKGAAAVAPLQRRFQAAIMHEAGARGAGALLRELEPSATMTAAERLQVYASAWFLRLRDVMKNDYPGVLHALGEAAFARVVREYLTRQPSRSFTLNDLGARFPAFLARSARASAVARRRAFLAELATLERAVEEVFHDRLVPPVDVERLRSFPPERWTSARFTLNPALRLLAFRHPVNAWLQSVRDGKKPRPPRGGRSLSSWTAVYRGKDSRAWRARLTREQFALLGALGRGRTLGTALERTLAAKGSDAGLVRAKLHDWFAEWTHEGLFVAIDLR